MKFKTGMKNKTFLFICSKCDTQYPKWVGQCRECSSWGTIQESVATSINQQSLKVSSGALIAVGDVTQGSEEVTPTKISELDRVLGAGIVRGSLLLLGGEPGIGKSTLVLQICDALQAPTLYVAGEESPQQIKSRIGRLGLPIATLRFLSENNIETVCAYLRQEQPTIAIVDSIQTMYSSELPSEAGSVNQVRVCTVKLLDVAKKLHITILIIGHVTKDGAVAGPKTLEHLVDTVMYLESSPRDGFRLLRSTKNRFGSTHELGVFEMTSRGLVEATNPSQLFLGNSPVDMSGSVTTCVMEGTRPFLVEIQALVSKSVFGYPQRKSSGFDQNRLHMLTAVLTKKVRAPLEDQDIHLNVTGGLKILEPAADVAVCLAILSSLYNTTIPRNTLCVGEVGLGGELRSVPHMERRIEEGKKLGYTSIISPATVKTIAEAAHYIRS